MKSIINGRINSNIDAHIKEDSDLTEGKLSFTDESKPQKVKGVKHE